MIAPAKFSRFFDPEMIQEIAVNFLGNLFKSEGSDQEAMKKILSKIRPSIPFPPKLHLDRPCTRNEMRAAIKSCKSSSSPGADGVPTIFFQKCIKSVTGPLVEIFNDLLEGGEVPQLFLERYIVLLEKNGDKRLMSNKRPISLLNAAARIFSKVGTRRMDQDMSEIIHPDQVGFMKDRDISDPIANFQVVLDQELPHAASGFVFCSDFVKAYDRVEQDWMDMVLEFYNFPPKFRRILRAFYSGGHASVIINSQISHRFNIGRGVPQGSSISLATSSIFNSNLFWN